MRGAKTLLKGLFAMAVVFGLVLCMSPRAIAETADLITITNQERIKNGLDPLTVNDALMRSAKLKAEHMLINNYWSHDAPDGTPPWDFINQSGYSYRLAGENLAKGFSTDSGVLLGLMNSESHRENILDPEFTEIGVSQVEGELLGKKTTLIVFHYGVAKDEKPADTAVGRLVEFAHTVLTKISYLPRIAASNNR